MICKIVTIRGVKNTIDKNIKHFRKAKGMSQEEMAVQLNVVRQTVSKWENGLSVPDADILIRMAELLNVSVSQLLGIEVEDKSNRELSEELSRLNEQLAQKNQKEKLLLQANKKRGLIVFFSFAAMLIDLLVKNEIVSILLVGFCVLSMLIVLYRNLALLTSITTNDMRLGILRITTFFNIGIFLVGVTFSLLVAFDIITLSDNGEKMLAMALVSCVILFAGIVSPKLPYTKHTGLRLPWTVQDEAAWNIAHRTIGYISFPVVLLYIGCTLTISNFEIVTLCTMSVWIGIPGGISYLYYFKKNHGNLK